MKLLNQSLKHLSLAIFLLMSVWSMVFYFSMQHEIKDVADEELENQKRLIIQYTVSDSTIQTKDSFDESLYTLQEISKKEALQAKDEYFDTEICMQDFDDEDLELEPVRMLITVFNAQDRYFQLKIANPIVEQDDLLEALLWNFIILYMLLIFSIIVVNNVVLKELWRPFYDFLNQLKSYKITRSTELPHAASQTKEFQDLEQAVNMMIQYSTNALNQQKEFIENASHELQTPLAIASNKLELLFEDEQLLAPQVEKIADTYEILQRLIRVNKSLLLFSKIENQQFLSAELVAVNEMIHQNLEELSEYIEFKSIAVTILHDEPIHYEMNHTLANILIGNLLKNAIFHNKENGAMDVDIQADRLRISNTGKSQALDANLLFNRFAKGKQSEKGTGLGLPIVYAIAQHQQLKINYSFAEEKHTFEIIFPPQP
ncbi:MAG: sensor histidine kinase [Mangrovibacterium sp.]